MIFANEKYNYLIDRYLNIELPIIFSKNQQKSQQRYRRPEIFPLG